MDERTKTLLVSAFVLIIILAIVFGIIFSIVRIVQNRRTASTSATPSPIVSQATPSVSPQVLGENGEPAPAPATPAPQPSGDFDSYSKGGVSFRYPKNWGILSCSNSQNIELDPANNSDQLDFVCDVALKPITVLVGSSNCPSGETASKGGVTFTKSQTSIPGGTSYKWCTKTTPALEITHRVSSDGSRATSSQDHSKQIEDMISTIRTSTAI
jgi:hypothetical protein